MEIIATEHILLLFVLFIDNSQPFFLIFFLSLFSSTDVLCISVAPMFLAAPAPAPVFMSDGAPGTGPENGSGTTTGVY
jgi:hypothetical protein